MVYLLVKRNLAANKLAQPGIGGFILIFAALAGVILLVGFATVMHTASKQRDAEVERLHAIGDLKVAQIVTWFKERHSDGQLIAYDGFLIDAYQEWVRTGSGVARRRVEDRLHSYRGLKDYLEIAVLGSDGEQISTSHNAAMLHEIGEVREAMKQAREKGKVISTGLYRLDKRMAGKVHLDFIVPLHAGSDQRGLLVVMRTDPNRFLFPFIQSWPIPSASAETLLFLRDNKDILFLNELRHRSNTALSLRIPFQGSQLLAAQVVRGEVLPGQRVEGRDYRGVPVVGVAKMVPGTPWFLVAKLDKWELYAGAKRDAAWIALAYISVLMAAAIAAIVIYQRAELRRAGMQRKEQEEKVQALQLLDAIVEGTTDAIYAKDGDGRYVLVNRGLCRSLCKARHEILGHGDSEIFPPEDAERIRSDDQKAIESGQIWSAEESLPTIGGRRNFLTTRGPLYSADGRAMGIFGIARDITESKFQDRQIRAGEARFRVIFNAVDEGILLHDLDNGTILEANTRISEMFGYGREELRRLAVTDMMGDSAPYARTVFAQWLERTSEGESRDFAWQGQHKDGHLFPVEISMRRANVAGRLCVLLLVRNVRGQPLDNHESI